jgi:hypothetical protein
VPKHKESFVNEELYEKSKSFVIKALSIITPFINQTPSGFKHEFLKLLLDRRKEIESLAEFKQCIQLMENDPTISKYIGKPVGVPNRLSNRSSWDYLSRILLRLIKSYYGNKRFDIYLFQKMYRDLETLCYNKTIPMVIQIPLQNFKSDISRARLDNGLSIRKITCDERQYLLDDLENLNLTFSEVIQIKYIVEYRFQERKIFNEHTSNSFHTDRIGIVEKVITSLRLFKCGDVGYYIVLERPILDTPILAGESRYPSFVSFPQGRTYSLMKKEIHRFRRYYKIISKIDLSKFVRLKIALDRFEYAYQRTSKDDKLLDYVISFEILLGNKDDKDSLTYKISVRFSRLCQRYYCEREKYSDVMKLIYKLRSAIVHGNENNKEKLWKKVNIDDVEEKLRELIKAYLIKINMGNRDHELIINHIDFD